MNISSYDKIGKSGIELMQKSMAAAETAATNMASGDLSIENIAQSSMDLTKAKIGMAMGAFLVKAQNELLESTLQIFGVGKKCNHVF